MTSTVDAFIPLKGHSERVPGKNLRDFGGRPLFHVIIDTLHRSGSVDRIFIDTDSDEIADSAHRLGGVEVLRRLPGLEGDDVSVNLLIGSFLERTDADHVIQTHATNPLLSTETIDAAVAAYFENDEALSLFSVTRHQARFYSFTGDPINHDPSELLPTQRLDPVYEENSNFYIFSRHGFSVAGRRIAPGGAMYEVDPIEAVDIDEERDFVLAERIAGAGVESR